MLPVGLSSFGESGETEVDARNPLPFIVMEKYRIAAVIQAIVKPKDSEMIYGKLPLLDI